MLLGIDFDRRHRAQVGKANVVLEREKICLQQGCINAMRLLKAPEQTPHSSLAHCIRRHWEREEEF